MLKSIGLATKHNIALIVHLQNNYILSFELSTL